MSRVRLGPCPALRARDGSATLVVGILLADLRVQLAKLAGQVLDSCVLAGAGALDHVRA